MLRHINSKFSKVTTFVSPIDVNCGSVLQLNPKIRPCCKTFSVDHRNVWNTQLTYSCLFNRCIHTTKICNLWGKKTPEEDKKKSETKYLKVVTQPDSESPQDKNKEAFLQIVNSFQQSRFIKRQGHVDFLESMIPKLQEFGVHKDIEAYKALMNIFPKDGRLKPANFIQAGHLHYPLQQRAAMRLLATMEWNNVMPDPELQGIVLETFSKNSYVWRKIGRAIYWFTKFKNASPFPLPEKLPLDALELAKLAMERMCVDAQNEIKIYATSKIEDAKDKTWIVSGQSPTQKDLINELEPEECIYVEGGYRIWLREQSITYFILRANNKFLSTDIEEEEIDDVSNIPLNTFGGVKQEEALAPNKSLHVQDDGTVLALCCTGTSSRDSLLSWIRILTITNPKLKALNVIFTLTSPSTEIATANEPPENEKMAKEKPVEETEREIKALKN